MDGHLQTSQEGHRRDGHTQDAMALDAKFSLKVPTLHHSDSHLDNPVASNN